MHPFAKKNKRYCKCDDAKRFSFFFFLYTLFTIQNFCPKRKRDHFKLSLVTVQNTKPIVKDVTLLNVEQRVDMYTKLSPSSINNKKSHAIVEERKLLAIILLLGTKICTHTSSLLGRLNAHQKISKSFQLCKT